jgi:arabinogalactan oligomer/maltooligosaccharide transport system permease protein
VGWRHVVGLLAVAFAVFPILYLVSAALNPLGSVVSTTLIPRTVSLDNFQALFGNPSRPFPRWLLNTLIVCTVVTFVQVFCSALAAYAFSRFRFTGRRLGLLSLLLIMLFPQILPRWRCSSCSPTSARSSRRSASTPWPATSSSCAASPWPGVAHQGLLRLHPALARRGGDHGRRRHATIFFQIILPLITPILAVSGLLAFVGVIGEFLLASIFLRDTA